MSGVLERMVRRALGTLPAIQPLAAPRYAPPANKGSEKLATRPDRQALDLQELNSEEEGADTFTDRPVDRRADKSEAQRSGQEHRPSQTTIHAEEPVTQRVLQAKSAPETPHHLPAEQRDEPVHLPQHEGSREAIEPPLTPAPTRPVDPAPAVVEDAAAMKARAKVEEPQPRATASPGKPAIQEAFAHSPAAQIAIPRAAQPEGITEQRTEIHISIGSIELRAPRPETKPVAPFRPQVSLDNYLQRDRGART